MAESSPLRLPVVVGVGEVQILNLGDLTIGVATVETKNGDTITVSLADDAAAKPLAHQLGKLLVDAGNVLLAGRRA